MPLLTLARGRGLSTQGRAIQGYSRSRPAATHRARRQANAARTLYGQGLENRAPIPPARRAGRFRPATPLVVSAQDPLLVLPAVGRTSRIRKHANCAPC